MKTRVLKTDPLRPDAAVIDEAARIIAAGGLVAFPTETVYGLGADALNGRAVRGIFAAKGRPADNPLIVHVAEPAQLPEVAQHVPEAVDALARHFWPGPLTVVVPRRPEVPDEVTAGLDTVAVRVPDHAVALALIRRSGRPLAAPSANRSGRPSPTEARHVWEDLQGRIDLIIDGGPCGIGLESTVLDLTASRPVILRPGAVTPEDLAPVIGPVDVDPRAEGLAGGEPGAGGPVRSPGMKYRHYAPRTPCVLYEGPPEAVAEAVAVRLREERARGRRVGLLATAESAGRWEADAVRIAGARSAPETIARSLYRCLRELDEAGVDLIIMEGIEPAGLGAAIMNRMRRAAGHRTVAVGPREPA